MMEIDRANPAFVLLPEFPPSLTNDKEQEGMQFELDQSESSEPIVKLPSTSLRETSIGDIDELSQNLRASLM